MTSVADNIFSSESFEPNVAIESEDPDVVVQRTLNRLARTVDDADARQTVRELLSLAAGRLLLLCGSTLRRHYPRLRKGPFNVQAEEVLSGVVQRLIKAMRTVRPAQIRAFFALAMKHIRWELNALARKLDADRLERLTPDLMAREPETNDEHLSALGYRMQEAICRLPHIDREIFDLVRVSGMTQSSAAEVLGITERTVHRRLKSILPQLLAQLGGPESPPELQGTRTLRPNLVAPDTAGSGSWPRHAA